MAETYRRLVELNTTTMPSTVISSLVAVNEFYNIGAEYSDLFLEPTCDRIEPYLLSKKYSLDVLNKNLTNSQTISDWLTPAMCDFNSDLSKKFIVALEDDNLTKGWTPHGDERIILVQSTIDDSVPVENTEELADFLRDNGLNIITSNSNAKYNPGTVFVYKKDFGNSFGGPHYAAAISFVEEFISAMRHYLNVKGIWFTLENLDELY